MSVSAHPINFRSIYEQMAKSSICWNRILIYLILCIHIDDAVLAMQCIHIYAPLALFSGTRGSFFPACWAQSQSLKVNWGRMGGKCVQLSDGYVDRVYIVIFEFKLIPIRWEFHNHRHYFQLATSSSIRLVVRIAYRIDLNSLVVW